MDSELGAGVAYVSPLLIGAYLLTTLSAGVFSTERTGKRQIRVQNIDSPLLAIDFLASSRVAAGSETVGELALFFNSG
jgi:hypothetical protein